MDAKTDDDILNKLRNCFPKNPERAFQAYKLMRYVLATNRSSIRQLKPEEAV